jgi:hypothetical protein
VRWVEVASYARDSYSPDGAGENYESREVKEPMVGQTDISKFRVELEQSLSEKEMELESHISLNQWKLTETRFWVYQTPEKTR